MNILVVGEAGTWFDRHVTGSLREAGHRVWVFHYGNAVGEYYPRARRREREEKNRDLCRRSSEIKAAYGLDLIFCYVYDDFLLPEAAAALRSLGAPMLNYNVDMTNQWYRQTRIARYFTGSLCAQRVHMRDLARYGPPVHYFPMAARAPTSGRSELEIRAPVTFVGTPTRYRMAVLSALVEAGIPLAIYGKFWNEGRMAAPARSVGKTLDDSQTYGWARLRAEGLGALWGALADRFAGDQQSRCKLTKIEPSLLHGFLPDSDLAAVFRGSRINLGFTRMVGDDPRRPGATQVKLRDFEVPACGGFYLVEQAPDYDELFAIGREVETWRTPGELIEKIRYYLAHEDERAAIAAAGQRRALGEHLWTHRFSHLFAELGIG